MYHFIPIQAVHGVWFRPYDFYDCVQKANPMKYTHGTLYMDVFRVFHNDFQTSEIHLN